MAVAGVRLSELKVKRQAGVLDFYGGKGKSTRNLKAILAAEHYDLISIATPSFLNIEAPPSTLPTKKYCDITGLPAKYSDPKTKVRFANVDAFQYERQLPEHRVEEFLALRDARTRIQ